MTYHSDHNRAGAEKMKLSKAANETLKECAGGVKTAANEQCPARAVANDINELEFYRHQVDLLRRFVPEFEQRYSRLPSGTNKFYFRDGSVPLYSSYKANLRLSLSFADVVRVLMALYGNTPAEA
jgi:hypothetical protein